MPQTIPFALFMLLSVPFSIWGQNAAEAYSSVPQPESTAPQSDPNYRSIQPFRWSQSAGRSHSAPGRFKDLRNSGKILAASFAVGKVPHEATAEGLERFLTVILGSTPEKRVVAGLQKVVTSEAAKSISRAITVIVAAVFVYDGYKLCAAIYDDWKSLRYEDEQIHRYFPVGENQAALNLLLDSAHPASAR
jgi:hypothetical protein